MARLEYDVIIISSRFGGSVVALSAADVGYRVGVMSSLSSTALAGRAMLVWSNKVTQTPARPSPATSASILLMPHRPSSGPALPRELRLDAKKWNLIPDYPY